MIDFLRAHGFDPGPTQRPMLAGAVTGVIATVPAAIVFVVAGSFRVLSSEIFRLPAVVTAIIFAVAFVVAGASYGLVFRRAANDRRGGWLFGLTFGFMMWIVAPVVVLPLVGRPIIAAGTPAVGFLAAFLAWGLCVGVLFPYVHEPLHANLDGLSNDLLDKLGPGAAVHRDGRLPSSPS